MVLTMNKTSFIKKLQKNLNYDKEKCIIINDVMESTSLFGKKSKDKMVSDLIIRLNITNSEANRIYEIAMNIITTEIKNKIKHPFRSQD